MKKITLLMGLSLLLFSFAACSDDDNERIDQNELPTVARSFLSEYFPGQTATRMERDNDEYEVYFSNYKVEFNRQGEWKQIDGKRVPNDYRAVPANFVTTELPAGIQTWVTTNYPGTYIVEVEKEYTNNTHVGYDIELNNGMDDLDFDLQGNYLGAGNPPSTTTLPEAAQTFLTTYFPADAVATQRRDDDGDYEVRLNSGIEIDFNSQGVWTNVDGKFDNGQFAALPDAFLTAELPEALLTFVTVNYPGRQIIEVDKEFHNNTLAGYEVDLNGNVEIDFDTTGNLIGSGGTTPATLPQAAADFMAAHFNGLTYTTIPDDGEYDVYADGYKVEFTGQGDWKEVDGTIIRGQQKPLPASFLALEPLNLITDYLLVQYPTASVVDVEKEYNNGQHTGYEFKLDNNAELMFNLAGAPVISGGESSIIGVESLPQAAQTFLSTHFGNVAVRYILQDRDEYEVYLAGYNLEFDLQGNWTKVDGYVGRVKTPLPASFLALAPVNAINAYVVANYPAASINEIEKDYDNNVMHYDVELDNNIDLIFDANGAFVRRD